MAHDEHLADRLRVLLEPVPDVTEKRMFGGLAFLVGGRMAIAAGGDGGLLARVLPQDAEGLCLEPGVEPAVMGNRTMTGWLFVDAAAVVEEDALAAWVQRGVAIAAALPPK